MAAVLLDTHALYWLVSGDNRLTEGALVAIGESQSAAALLVSPITAWELAIAAQKRRHSERPELGAATPAVWFREAVKATSAKVVRIGTRIALEAADVAAFTGHRDPGDCYLIATARIRRVALVTRDARLLRLAQQQPSYLATIAC